MLEKLKSLHGIVVACLSFCFPYQQRGRQQKHVSSREKAFCILSVLLNLSAETFFQLCFPVVLQIFHLRQ